MEEEDLQNLIIRYLSKETTPEEESELLEWVAKDPANLITFKEWQQVWNNAPVTEPVFDVRHGLDRLNRAINASEEKNTGGSWRRLAASIAIFLISSFTIYFIAKHSVKDTQLIPYKEQITTAGQRTVVTLEDGSTITLNANSSFKYPTVFALNKREVFLNGEAFFEVTKDAKRPFIIHSGDVDTQVLGTSFNINSRNDFVTVSVATGKVKVIQGNTSETILPREKVVYGSQRKRMLKSPANLEYELAWKDNTIIFNDSQLSHVALKLQEFYGISVVFEDENLKKCFVTGKFSNEPVEAVLKAISFSTGIQYRVSGKKITLYGRGCQ